MHRVFITLAVACLLAGCVSSRVYRESYAALTEQNSGPKDYAIRAGDILQIDVFQEPELTTRQRVSQNGVISMPLIGSTQIAGLSAAEGARRIAALLDAKYVVKPFVTITILNYAPRSVTVMGQVRTPGTIVLPNEDQMTLPQAIATAGGPTDIGDLKNVIVTRKIDGQNRPFRVNALSPDANDIIVREGDTINVKETIF